jgi:hypothetical protein
MNLGAIIRYLRPSGTLCRALACVALIVVCSATRASVAVLLEEPYGEMGRMNPTGHSAVYFDHICAESPTMLRPCRTGELGAVISRYDGINGYDWLAIPIVPYLYAVDAAEDIPMTADREVEDRLRDAYRRAHFAGFAPDLPDGTAPGGNWYELVGSAYDRSLYAFQVDTTAEQEAKLIAQFNDSKNVQLYNGAFRNCADFTRVTLNRFYPHAIRRNFIADFGLTTPKSVARALTHYAKKHPETNLRIYKIPQVKGEIPRSHRTQGVAESLLKRYGVPLVLISPVSATVVFAAYVQHGRFALPKHPELVDFREPSSVMVASSSVAVNGSAEYVTPELLAEIPQELPMDTESVTPGKSMTPVQVIAPALGAGEGFGASGMYPSLFVSPFVLPGDIFSIGN